MTLADLAAQLGDAQRELAAAIDRQSKPEPGWNLEPWGRHAGRAVEVARAKRDAIATEYRAAVVGMQRALQDRKPGYFAERREQAHD